MYFERILIANAQRPCWAEHDFALEPGRLRRWNLLPLGAPASRLLQLLAVGGLGRRQIDTFRAFLPSVFRQLDPPVRIEVVQVGPGVWSQDSTFGGHGLFRYSPNSAAKALRRLA